MEKVTIRDEEDVIIEEKVMGPWKELFVRFISNRSALIFSIIFLIFLIGILSAPLWLDRELAYRFTDADKVSPFTTVEITYKVGFDTITESKFFLFGSDDFGRDYFARVVYGSRSALWMAIIIITVSAGLGTTVGAISGYFGGKTDFIIMRIVDVLLSIPGILMAMAIASALTPGVFSLVVALSISRIPSFSRVIRSTVLSLKNMEYIEAAHAVGTSTPRIIFKHIIPNTLSPIIVQVTLGLAGVMLSLSGLSFLGFGLPQPEPDLGGLIASGRQFFSTHMYLINIPGIVIVYIILTFNILGDAFRDALDPKLRD